MKNEPSQLSESGLANPSDRLFYFDWLRVITVIAVFFHHCSRIFDLRNNHPITSLPLTIHREFDHLWMMPLLFIISGAAVYYSMNARNAGGFIKERLTRILLPFLTVGAFIIVPPLTYVDRLMNNAVAVNFFDWYPNYVKHEYLVGGSGHLWYLQFLFAYTLILLPFFIPFGKQRVSLLWRFSNLFNKSWRVFLLFIPLIAIAPLEIYSTRLAGGWDFLEYLIFFICGYLFFSNEQIRESIGKYCILNLAAAFALTVIYLYLEFSALIPEISSYMIKEYATLSGHVHNPSELSMTLAAYFILRHIAACCWMLAILGLGKRYLNFNNQFIEYANEAALPFYILHMTVIYLIAYFVIQGAISIATQYMVIATSSFLAIMILYEYLIRRINILRLLFGMKLKKSFKKEKT